MLLMHAPRFAVTALLAAASVGTAALAAPAKAPAAPGHPAPVCETVALAPVVTLSLGKSTLVRPPAPVARIVMGQPGAAAAAAPEAGAARSGVADIDLVLLSPSELYLMGKSLGTTNVVLAGRDGRCTAFDVVVSMDTTALQATLQQLLPDEKEVKVSAAFDSIVLSGVVSDTEALARITELAGAYVRNASRPPAPGQATSVAHPRVVNMLAVAAPQQVMLEVKVAEVSKALIDKLGVQLGGSKANGNWTYNVLADFLSNGNGVVSAARQSVSSLLSITVDAQKDDGLVKVLAEPTIMAVSGQTGSFLAGGKVFIPVALSTVNNTREITLEEKTFGVSVSFTPTVLGSGRINLKVKPEVSELNKDGVTLMSSNTNGTAILPSFTARSAETTVQLMDGQSFAIGGLIKNNTTTNIKALPFLGELPVLGALFRSSQFQTDRTELVFVITPRLVKPLPANYSLPTDRYVPPTRSELIWGGKTEGAPVEREPSAGHPPAVGGFELPGKTEK